MRVKIIFFLIFLNYLPSFGQTDNLNSRLEKIVQEIAENNELLSEAIGLTGTPTEQYKRFEVLKKEATKKQLAELTNHQNAVVRSYVFWALSDRKSNNLFPILKNHLNDDETITTQFGCVVREMKVADFYIELLTKDYLITEDYLRENNSSLSLENKISLDSIILNTPNNLEYLNRVLSQHNPTNDKDYSRIKEIVKQGNYVALPALAKYQKNQDVDLILSFTEIIEEPNMYPHPYKSIFQAMGNFPNDSFNSFLIKYGNNIIDDKGFSSYWVDFYNTCAKYNNEETIKILNKPFADGDLKIPMKRYHLRFITKALGKYPSNENKELIIKLWKKYKSIDKGSFTFLKNSNAKLTFEIIQDYMSDFEDVYSGADEQELIPVIIPFALEYDKKKTLDIIISNLRTNTITPFKEWAKIAIELKDESFIESLLNQIVEGNQYRKFDVARILLAYERNDIDQNLFKVINSTLEEEYKTVSEMKEILLEWE